MQGSDPLKNYPTFSLCNRHFASNDATLRAIFCAKHIKSPVLQALEPIRNVLVGYKFFQTGGFLKGGNGTVATPLGE